MRKLTDFSDGTSLVFRNGRFDNYLVSFVADGNVIHNPTDIEAFTYLHAVVSDADKETTLMKIGTMCLQVSKSTSFSDINFPKFESLAEAKILSFLAAAMIAEERKKKAYFGKYLKMLGCYQIIRLDFTPEEAASWSRGRYAGEITKALQNVRAYLATLQQPRLI